VRTTAQVLVLALLVLALFVPASLARAADGSSSMRSPYVPAGYACAWHDEFGGPAGGGQPRAKVNDAFWTFQELNVNDEAQVYTTKQCTDRADWNTCVENGSLRLQPRAEEIDCARDAGVCAPHFTEKFHAKARYSSGRLITKHKVHFDGGYIEFRVKLPQADRPGAPESGLWPAVWLLGENISEGPPPGDVKWPACGEIDIMEWSSMGGASKQGWNALWAGPGGLNACSEWPQGGNAACGPCPAVDGQCVGATTANGRHRMNGWKNFDHHAWHTYGFEWVNAGDDARDQMTYFIDGVKMGVLHLGPEQRAFKSDMFLIINLALGGNLGGRIDVKDWERAGMDVDYVRWYRKGASDACGEQPQGAKASKPVKASKAGRK
jgi:beta-glucanase (GH16 family)